MLNVFVHYIAEKAEISRSEIKALDWQVDADEGSREFDFFTTGRISREGGVSCSANNFRFEFSVLGFYG